MSPESESNAMLSELSWRDRLNFWRAGAGMKGGRKDSEEGEGGEGGERKGKQKWQEGMNRGEI